MRSAGRSSSGIVRHIARSPRRSRARTAPRTGRREAPAGCRRQTSAGRRPAAAGRRDRARPSNGSKYSPRQRIQRDGVDGKVAAPRRFLNRHRRIAGHHEAAVPAARLRIAPRQRHVDAAKFVDLKALADRLDPPERSSSARRRSAGTRTPRGRRPSTSACPSSRSRTQPPTISARPPASRTARAMSPTRSSVALMPARPRSPSAVSFVADRLAAAALDEPIGEARRDGIQHDERARLGVRVDLGHGLLDRARDRVGDRPTTLPRTERARRACRARATSRRRTRSRSKRDTRRSRGCRSGSSARRHSARPTCANFVAAYAPMYGTPRLPTIDDTTMTCPGAWRRNTRQRRARGVDRCRCSSRRSVRASAPA